MNSAVNSARNRGCSSAKETRRLTKTSPLARPVDFLTAKQHGAGRHDPIALLESAKDAAGSAPVGARLDGAARECVVVDRDVDEALVALRENRARWDADRLLRLVQPEQHRGKHLGLEFQF